MVGQQRVSPAARHQHPTEVAGQGDGHQPACPQVALLAAFCAPGAVGAGGCHRAPKMTWKCCAQAGGTGGSGNKVWQNKQKRLLFNQKNSFQKYSRLWRKNEAMKDKLPKLQIFAFKRMKENPASQESNRHWSEITVSAVKTMLSSPGTVIAISFETWTRNWYKFQ